MAMPQKPRPAGITTRRYSRRASGASASAATSPRAAMKASGPTWPIADFWNRKATPQTAAAKSRARSALRRDSDAAAGGASDFDGSTDMRRGPSRQETQSVCAAEMTRVPAPDQFHNKTMLKSPLCAVAQRMTLICGIHSTVQPLQHLLWPGCAHRPKASP
jgi:hypothetical protein